MRIKSFIAASGALAILAAFLAFPAAAQQKSGPVAPVCAGCHEAQWKAIDLTQHDVDPKILHRRVEKFLDYPAQPVDFVDEQDAAGLAEDSVADSPRDSATSNSRARRAG